MASSTGCGRAAVVSTAGAGAGAGAGATVSVTGAATVVTVCDDRRDRAEIERVRGGCAQAHGQPGADQHEPEQEGGEQEARAARVHLGPRRGITRENPVLPSHRIAGTRPGAGGNDESACVAR